MVEISKAVDFYHRLLGFNVGMQTTDPVPYAIVSRDGVAIHLTVEDSRRGKGAMYAATDDVDTLHAELAGKGVRIVEPPDDRAYGMRDMDFNDCCGNMIGFGPPPGR